MVIEIKDFQLRPDSYNGFDLIRFVKSKRVGEGSIVNPTGEEYIKEDELGYNMSLEHCITRVIHLLLKDTETVVSLKEYIKEYKNLKEEILNILK